MKKIHNYILLFFIISFGLIFTGAICRILGIDNSDILLAMGVITTFVSIVLFLVDVFNNRRNNQNKLLWVFVTFSTLGLAPLLYLIFRKKV